MPRQVTFAPLPGGPWWWLAWRLLWAAGRTACHRLRSQGPRSLASRWPRAARLPQYRPVPGPSQPSFVVDPSLTVDRVHGDIPYPPLEPDSPHQVGPGGSLGYRQSLPSQPARGLVPGARLRWRIWAPGRVLGTGVHTILPEARILHDLAWCGRTTVRSCVTSTHRYRPPRDSDRRAIVADP